MPNEIDWSNWINFCILCVTALVGILTWLGARKAAKEAREDQKKANAAAERSANAAEEATALQARMVKIEEQRHDDVTLSAKRAVLHAVRTSKNLPAFRRMQKHDYLTIINSGQAAATRLDVLVNRKPLTAYSEFLSQLPETMSIGPRGQLELELIGHLGGSLRFPFDVSLSWDDQSGVRGQWSGTIS